MPYLIIIILFVFGPNVSAQKTTPFIPSITQVSFTLRNNSLKSIPLKIPGVMNPNLSPISNSGVTLRIGQEIFFRHKGKNRLLVTTTEALSDQIIVVNELIAQRKQALMQEKGSKIE